MNISSYTQEILCYVGQQAVFEEAQALLSKLLGVEINAKQIERVCHYIGEEIEKGDKSIIETQIHREYSLEEKNQLHYAMLDGAMYLTREDKWKEAKMGRIFKDSDNINISKNRGLITGSQYVVHLGGHKEFLSKFEYHLDGLKSLAIIADGATWIWNWADCFYPGSVQILDYYHALEHLCEFAINYFKDGDKRTNWIEEQSKILINEDVQQVIDSLKELPTSPNNKTEKQKGKLINYYTKNRKRMRYKVFRKRGLLIGSGAIESAHRTVLQQRMKLSGQRWTKKGFQQIANIRANLKSGNWDRIINLTKNAA
jgi:hypothetical protein